MPQLGWTKKTLLPGGLEPTTSGLNWAALDQTELNCPMSWMFAVSLFVCLVVWMIFKGNSANSHKGIICHFCQLGLFVVYWGLLDSWPNCEMLFSNQFVDLKKKIMQVARRPSRCGLQLILARGRCHPLLWLKQGYPLYSPYGCRLGYCPSEAWLVEQKALPPKLSSWSSVLLKDTSVTTRTWTHTLLIKHQSLNPVL